MVGETASRGDMRRHVTRDSAGAGGRASARPPGHRSTSAAACLAAALVVALGCTTPPASPSPSPPSAGSDDACASVRASLPCRSVVVDGRIQRYAVVPASEPSENKIALVDLGGPGRSLFGDDGVPAFGAAWGSAHTLVFLEEPWAAAPLTAGCRDALSRTYVSLKSGSAGDLDLADSCPGLWGWAPDEYVRTVEAVLQDVRIDIPDAALAGTVGISQGAERTSWLWKATQPAWAALVSPSLRVRSASEYLSQRTAAIVDSWIGLCPGCTDAAAVNEFLAAAAEPWASAPIAIADRSVPVDAFDAAAAMVAASYASRDVRTALAAALVEHSEEAARSVGTLSDGLMMRYGVHDMAAGQLAYFQEICGLHSGWDEVVAATGSVVETFLALVHKPCADFDSFGSLSDPTPPPVACLASTPDDGVTGEGATMDWATLLGPRAALVEEPGLQHGALELAAACRSALGLEGT
jgi:hypothetical protein